MGVKCIRTQQAALPQKQPIFLGRNMAKVCRTDPRTQYQFLQKIGKGGFSQVYKVRSKLTGNFRAIKQLERKDNTKIEQQIKNQFNILRELDHPNIMKTYEYFEDQRFIYIVCELCQGTELFDTISQNKCLNEQHAREIFYDIAVAVNYMHQNHFMHRDLKPQNIIYDSLSKTTKIIDMGTALQFVSSQPEQRKKVGTIYYVAPQVLIRFYNQKCDVWSLGIILFIMLCGEPPFNGKTDQVIIENIRAGKFQFKRSVWNTVSHSAKSLISKMLNRNLMQRISVKQVLKDEWFLAVIEDRQTNMSEEDVKSVISCLSNLRTFKDVKSDRLQNGIITFIVNFVRSNEDSSQLYHCFKTLDLNGDGVLSQQQLSVGLMKYLKIGYKQGSKIAKAIFDKVDVNKSGFLDYSEFVLAASNFQLTVSEQNLDMAFDYLDEDKNGRLSVNELKKRLGENISEESYKNMMGEFDINKDGTIERQQFKQMMRRLWQK